MTSEAVAVVRAFFDAGDDEARMSDSLDPEVVWYGTRGGLDEARVMQGPEAVLAYLQEIREAWEQYDVQVEQMVEIDDGVLVFMQETAQTRQGALELQDHTAMIFKVRNGKIAEMAGYLEPDEALRAAGLKSQ
jgi:ketosteroid isomerase-like protein